MSGKTSVPRLKFNNRARPAERPDVCVSDDAMRVMLENPLSPYRIDHAPTDLDWDRVDQLPL